MLQGHQQFFSAAVRLTDLGILVLSAWAARALTLLQDSGLLSPAGAVSEFACQATVLALAWLFFAQRADFYRSRRGERLPLEVEALLETSVSSFGLALLLSAAIHGSMAFDPLTGFLFASSAILGHRCVVRASLRHFRARGQNSRNVVFLGRGDGSRRMANEVLENDHFGLRLCGTLAFEAEKTPSPAGLPDLGQGKDLKHVIADSSVDTVVVCPPPEASIGEIQHAFATCDQAGVPCHYAPGYFTPHNLRPSVAWYGSIPTLAFHGGPQAPVSLAIKRAMDVAGAVLGIVLLAPVLVACVIAIKRHDRGPILHRQRRSGLRGRPFTFLKFRSMCIDAESRQRDLETENEVDGPVFKIRRDPRITPIGRRLRKYSLDELPQLYNVLKGDMSLVGPRPPIPAEVECYDWWQRRRLSVKPGLTCIWQIWGRNRVSFQRWMEMDLQYIDNWSLWMDIKLLVRTVGVVLRGTGV